MVYVRTGRRHADAVPSRSRPRPWSRPGWITDHESYFDFKAREGAFPNLGKVQMGATVDLQRWILKAAASAAPPASRSASTVRSPPISPQRPTRSLPARSCARPAEICEPCGCARPRGDRPDARAMDSFSRVHGLRPRLRPGAWQPTPGSLRCSARPSVRRRPVMKDVRRDGKPHTAVGVQLRHRGAHGDRHRLPIRTSSITTASARGTRSRSRGGAHHRGCGGGCTAPIRSSRGHGGGRRSGRCTPTAAASRAEAVGGRSDLLVRRQEGPRSPGGERTGEIHLSRRLTARDGRGTAALHRPRDHTMLEEGMMFSNVPGLYRARSRMRLQTTPTSCWWARSAASRCRASPFTKEWCTLKL